MVKSVCAKLSSCSCAALTTRGCECPTFRQPTPPVKSMNVLPSTSVSRAPWPSWTAMGNVSESGAAMTRSLRSRSDLDLGPGRAVRSSIARAVAIDRTIADGPAGLHTEYPACSKRLATNGSPLESPGGPVRPNDPPRARRGPDRDRPVRREPDPAVQRGRPRRPLLPRVPQRPLPVHRRQAADGGPDRAGRGRGRERLHPPSQRVRARLDARADPAAGRPRGPTGGEVESWEAGPADPLDRRLHRPRLERPGHARAVERVQPAHHDLPRHEDRPGLIRPAHGAGREPVRQRRDRLEVPGPEGTRPEPLLAELRAGAGNVILVTGGTGFVGPKIVHALRSRDLPVRALVRDPDKSSQLVSWGCELVRGDMTRPGSLRAAADGCDTVVHLVSIRTGRPEQFEAIMAQGTRDLVDAARAAGVGRWIQMSASGVGEATKDLTPYYRAKWEVERAVEGSGIPHVIFRPTFVFGRDGGVLPTFIRQVRWLPATPVVGRGEGRVQPIWGDDVGAFFAEAAQREDVSGRVFELGGPD